MQLTLKIGNLFLAACTKKEEFSGTTGKYRKGRNKMGSKRAAVAAAGKKRKEREERRGAATTGREGIGRSDSSLFGNTFHPSTNADRTS